MYLRRELVPLLLLGVLLGGCAGWGTLDEPPRLSIVSLKVAEATLLEQRFKMLLRIQNPNPEPLEVSGMHYEVEVNGKSFVNGVSNQAVTVPAYGDAVIEADGISTLFGLVRQVQRLQDENAGGLSYRIRGKLNVTNRAFGVPFDYAGELSFPAGGDEPQEEEPPRGTQPPSPQDVPVPPPPAGTTAI